MSYEEATCMVAILCPKFIGRTPRPIRLDISSRAKTFDLEEMTLPIFRAGVCENGIE